ncbi:hypothetical protein A7982_13071 [Minicystis rosea]|nr:hypothetical protein A7982_13071 [Minicystis rosea]
MLVGCGHPETESQPDGKNQRPPAATRVLYGPRSSTKLTPYPSNRYTSVDGASPTGQRLSITTDTTGDTLPVLYPSITNQLNEQDGFSNIGGITIHFSGAVDPTSFMRASEDYRAQGSPLRLIDVDPSSPERGSTRGLVVRYYPEDAGDGQSGDYLLVAQPSTPLRQRTTYLFVVTDALQDASGAAVGASDEMALVLDGQPKGTYEQSIRDALDFIREPQALTVDHVALASIFTTQTVHDETLAVAAAVRASPLSSLDGEVTLAQIAEDEPNGRIAFRGRFTAPEWRSATDGRFRFDAGGAPIVQSEASLEFQLVFSNRQISGPRPVVIFAHGLGASKAMTWDAAGWLADQGVAVIGIDAPGHGSRAAEGDKGSMFDKAFSFFAVDIDTRTFDLARGADNFRQMSSDQVELVRALTGPLANLDLLPSGAPDGVPDLDPSRVAYLGQSFGAILGPTALALAPELRGGVLNVAGGGLGTIIHESPAFQLILPGLFEPGTTKGDIARILSAAQGLYDSGDPLNFARFVTLEPLPSATGSSPKSVLVQEAMNDVLVPNDATALLARTLGLTHVTPAVAPIEGVKTAPAPFSGNLAEGATGGVFQFDKTDGKTADHNTLAGSSEGRAQYGAFLKSLFDGAPAVIINPYAGQP